MKIVPRKMLSDKRLPRNQVKLVL